MKNNIVATQVTVVWCQ